MADFDKCIGFTRHINQNKVKVQKDNGAKKGGQDSKVILVSENPKLELKMPPINVGVNGMVKQEMESEIEKSPSSRKKPTKSSSKHKSESKKSNSNNSSPRSTKRSKASKSEQNDPEKTFDVKIPEKLEEVIPKESESNQENNMAPLFVPNKPVKIPETLAIVPPSKPLKTHTTRENSSKN